MREINPAREAAARRQLTRLVESVAVPPATSPIAEPPSSGPPPVASPITEALPPEPSPVDGAAPVDAVVADGTNRGGRAGDAGAATGPAPRGRAAGSDAEASGGGGPTGEADGATGPGGHLVVLAPRKRRLVVAAAAVVAVAGASAIAVMSGDGSPDTATAPANGAACAPREAEDGEIAEGEFEDGIPWRVWGGPMDVGEWIEGGFASIDGEGAGGWSHDAQSWPSLVNLGMLSWNVRFGGEHQVVYGQVPRSATRVEIELAGGHTIVACPVSVPPIDVVSYFGVGLPEGGVMVDGRALDAQGRAVVEIDEAFLAGVRDRQAANGEDGPAGINATIVPDLVRLPLGGEEAVPPPAPAFIDIVSGELPSGRWALQIGRVGSEVAVQMVLPTRAHPFLGQDEPDRLTGPDSVWHVEPYDRRHVVWGLTTLEVMAVVVTQGDGSTIEIPTVASGIPELEARAFAGTLPDGATITAMEGRRADGTVAQRAKGVAEAMADAADHTPGRSTVIVVEPVEEEAGG